MTTIHVHTKDTDQTIKMAIEGDKHTVKIQAKILLKGYQSMNIPTQILCLEHSFIINTNNYESYIFPY